MWKCTSCKITNDPHRIVCEACGVLNTQGGSGDQRQHAELFFGRKDEAGATPAIGAPVFTPCFGPPAVAKREFPAFTFNSIPADAADLTVVTLTAPAGDLRRATFGPGGEDEGLVVAGLTSSSTLSSELAGGGGWNSPTNFCQAMNTPVRSKRTSSPLLIGLEAEEIGCVDGSAYVTDLPTRRAARNKGLLYTWGSGECDQLALRQELLGDDGCRHAPALIKKFSAPDLVEVACGSMHTAAVGADGALYTWGCEDGGALGRPVLRFNEKKVCWRSHLDKLDLADWEVKAAKVPAKVHLSSKYSRIVKVSAGGSHTAVITDTGECLCWGSYRDHAGPIGFLSFPTPASASDQPVGSFEFRTLTEADEDDGIQWVPTLVPLRGVAVDLASGENHTVVLTVCGLQRLIYLWGSSEFGQCFQITNTPDSRLNCLAVRAFNTAELKFGDPKIAEKAHATSLKVLYVYAGSFTTFLSLEIDGKLRVFGVGRNSCGELGCGFVQNEVADLAEVRVPGLCKFVHLKGGDNSTVALSSDGSVWSWGRRDLVGLGSKVGATGEDVVEPSLVMGLKQKCAAVAVGGRTSYACSEGGLLFGWGEDDSFQLTRNAEEDSSEAVPTHTGLCYCPKYIARDFFGNKRVMAVAAGSQHCVALVSPDLDALLARKPQVEKREMDDKSPRSLKRPRLDAAIQEEQERKRARQQHDEEQGGVGEEDERPATPAVVKKGEESDEAQNRPALPPPELEPAKQTSDEEIPPPRTVSARKTATDAKPKPKVAASTRTTRSKKEKENKAPLADKGQDEPPLHRKQPAETQQATATENQQVNATEKQQAEPAQTEPAAEKPSKGRQPKSKATQGAAPRPKPALTKTAPEKAAGSERKTRRKVTQEAPLEKPAEEKVEEPLAEVTQASEPEAKDPQPTKTRAKREKRVIEEPEATVPPKKSPQVKKRSTAAKPKAAPSSSRPRRK